jgi:twitching motility protein PilT
VTLVLSLLQAIVRVDGDALVMHAGDRPYVVSPTGQVDLATRGLSLEAVDGIVSQLLSQESRAALEEFGAVQYELPPMLEFPGQEFTVVAARGGDDLWVEVRRHRVPATDRVPDEFFSTPTAPMRHEQLETTRRQVEDDAVPERVEEEALDEDDLTVPRATHLFPVASAESVEAVEDECGEEFAEESEVPAPPPVQPVQKVQPVRPAAEPPPPPVAATLAADAETAEVTPVAPPPRVVSPTPVVPPPPVAVAPPVAAVVLPMTRNPIRTETPVTSAIGDPTMDGLQRLLRISAARGASTLYLSSDSRPSVRVDGELQILDSGPVLTSRDVESLLLTLMPERSHEALRTGAPTEWICEIEEVGRVRCTTFRDHIGAGGVFRLMPTKTISAEQLGLPKAIEALAIEPEGIVLVAGPRSSGKRTVLSAFVDVINRTRHDHVIMIEREISIVHARGNSFISQREVRGSDDDLLAAARAALREDPDVLVLDDLRTGGLMNVALEAASSGRLVIGGFSAHTATAAIDRIIDLYGAEHRRQVQLAIADNLRGVLAQVLLRKIGGGRVAAREVLLNTPAVSSVIAEGKTSSLPMAIEGGRRYGMMPFSDSLVALVQSGVVAPGEAYRHATDRAGFLAALKREGVDTSQLSNLNAQLG